MSKWYFVEKEERRGPFSFDELLEKIDKETIVWKKGMENWEKARDLEQFAEYFSETPPPIPSKETSSHSELPEVPVSSKAERARKRVDRAHIFAYLLLFLTLLLGVLEGMDLAESRGYRFGIIASTYSVVYIYLGLKSYFNAIHEEYKLNSTLSWMIGLSIAAVPFELFFTNTKFENWLDRQDELYTIAFGLFILIFVAMYLFQSLNLCIKLIQQSEKSPTGFKVYAVISILAFGYLLLVPFVDEDAVDNISFVEILLQVVASGFLISGFSKAKEEVNRLA